MNRDMNFWRCQVCDYLGPGHAKDGHVSCPDCGHNQLEGSWVRMECTVCGFNAQVYQPIGAYDIPEHCCGDDGECTLMVSQESVNAFKA